MSFAVWLTVFAVSSFAHTEASTPALRVRLTKNGMTYLGTVGKSLLQEAVQKNTKIPPFEKQDGDATLKFYGGSITGFNSPLLSLSPSPPNILSIITTGGAISAKGSGSVKYKIWFAHPGFHYDLTASATNLKFSVSTALEVTADGHLQLGWKQCSADVGDVNLDFSGSIVAHIINLFRSYVEKYIKDLLNKELCKQLQSLVTGKVNGDLLKLTQSFKVIDDFKLNYDFAAPQVTSTVADVLFGGSLQYKTEPAVAITTPPLPVSADAQKMVYLWGADDIVNTFLNVAHAKGVLHYRLDRQEEPSIAKYLATTCPLLCVGQLLPAIGQKYPNTYVYVALSSYAPPTLNIVQDKANFHLEATMSLKLEKPADVLLLSGRLVFDGVVDVHLRTDAQAESKVYGNLTLTSPLTISNVTSTVGNSTAQELQGLMKIVEPLLVAKLNLGINSGIAIPAIPALNLIDPEVHLIQDFVSIGSSVKYTG